MPRIDKENDQNGLTSVEIQEGIRSLGVVSARSLGIDSVTESTLEQEVDIRPILSRQNILKHNIPVELRTMLQAIRITGSYFPTSRLYLCTPAEEPYDHLELRLMEGKKLLSQLGVEYKKGLDSNEVKFYCSGNGTIVVDLGVRAIQASSASEIINYASAFISIAEQLQNPL